MSPVRKPISSRHLAFTLIELLIVITIIALLAAILFPAFSSAREKARQATCQSNLKQIYLGLRQYSQDYDGSYPLKANLGSSSYRYVADPQSLPQLILPYTKSEQIWYCRSQKSEQSDNGMPGYNWTQNDNILKNPDAVEDVDSTQLFIYENYPYKAPTPLNGTGSPTSWASAGGKSYCAHAGNKNFNFLSLDGHVRLYPWKNALSICK